MGDKTEEKKLICIGCPMGCPITVVMCGKEVVSITGNTCSHGAKYAAKEVTAPTRVLTTTVRVAGQKTRMLSVKTRTDIPKEKNLSGSFCPEKSGGSTTCQNRRRYSGKRSFHRG